MITGRQGLPVAAVPRRTGQRVVRGGPQKFCRIRPALRVGPISQHNSPAARPRGNDIFIEVRDQRAAEAPDGQLYSDGFLTVRLQPRDGRREPRRVLRPR